MRIGNRGDQTRSFQGDMSELAMWNRILTADEAIGVTNRISPLAYPNGLLFYIRLIRTAADLITGTTLTVTGTTVTTHPRMIYPTSPATPIGMVPAIVVPAFLPAGALSGMD